MPSWRAIMAKNNVPYHYLEAKALLFARSFAAVAAGAVVASGAVAVAVTMEVATEAAGPEIAVASAVAKVAAVATSLSLPLSSVPMTKNVMSARMMGNLTYRWA